MATQVALAFKKVYYPEHRLYIIHHRNRVMCVRKYDKLISIITVICLTFNYFPCWAGGNEITINYQGNLYKRTFSGDEKILSYNVKEMGGTLFVIARVQAYEVGTSGSPMNLQLCYVFIPDIQKENSSGELKMTYGPAVLKAWTDDEDEPTTDKSQVTLEKVNDQPCIVVKNLKDPADITLYYFYRPSEFRFMRKRLY